MRDKETRFVPIENIELRVEGDGEEGRAISGYVAVYDSWSPVYGDFRERIAPGFFDAALSREDADVRALFNHDPNYVLGRTKSGTLELRSDDTGLRMHNPPPDTTWARDLAASMERGDITGASFSFSLPDEGGDEWAKGEDGVMERTLVQAERIYDVGPVAMPFYPETKVDVKVARRSLEAWEAEHAPVEEPAEEPELPDTVEERGRIIEGNNDADLRERLRVALTNVEPAAEYLYVEAVYDAEVVYEMRENDGPFNLYSRTYAMGSDGEPEVGADRQEVRRRVSYEVVDDEGMRDAFPLALLERMQRQREAEAV